MYNVVKALTNPGINGIIIVVKLTNVRNYTFNYLR